MSSKRIINDGVPFSQLLAAKLDANPDLKRTDSEVGRWFDMSAPTGARIKAGSFDDTIQTLRKGLGSPADEPLLMSLLEGTGWVFSRSECEPVDADGNGTITKNDVQLLSLTSASKGLEKIACLQRATSGRGYLPHQLAELQTIANDVIAAVRQTVATAEHLSVTGPRAAI
jgi:hypothetical protein